MLGYKTACYTWQSTVMGCITDCLQFLMHINRHYLSWVECLRRIAVKLYFTTIVCTISTHGTATEQAHGHVHIKG